jgi:hypothetical protein
MAERAPQILNMTHLDGSAPKAARTPRGTAPTKTAKQSS